MTSSVLYIMLIWAASGNTSAPATVNGFSSLSTCEHAQSSVELTYVQQLRIPFVRTRCIAIDNRER